MKLKWLWLFLLLSLSLSAQTFDSELAQVQEALNAFDQAAEMKVGSLESSLSSALADNARLQQELSQSNAALDVKLFDHLEFGQWNINSIAAQIGGSGLGTASVAAPATNAAYFSIIPTGAYFDTYFSQHLGPGNDRKRFILELWFYLADSANSNALQALEFEVRQPSLGLTFGYAFQLEFTGKGLRTYDFAGHSWIATGIPMLRLSAGQWHRIITEFHRDDANYYVDAFTLDGVRSQLNIQRPAPVTNWTDDIKVAVQLDGNGTGKPSKVYFLGNLRAYGATP